MEVQSHHRKIIIRDRSRYRSLEAIVRDIKGCKKDERESEDG